jgi:hypothetical protein
MSETTELYKLILSYDVNTDNVQEYYRFVMGRYLPMMQSMGLEMTEAWSTAWGSAPNRQLAFVARDLDTMYELLEDEAWSALNEQLDEFVTEFDYKVVPYREGFQI